MDVRAGHEDRYLVQNCDVQNCDGRTDNYSLPPHLSPLRSFLTKVKTDLSTIFGQESLGMLLHMAV